jgi:hypothetical protein
MICTLMENKLNALIYVHGWNSSGDGETANRMRKLFGEDFEVFCPTLSKNPQENIKMLRKLVLDCVLSGKEPILVGSSWGGLFALIVARLYSTRCVLINPSLNPTENLKKYSGALDEEETYKAYWKLQRSVWGDAKYYKHIPMCFLIGTEDTVVKPEDNGLLYCNEAGHRVVYLNEGHRLSSESSFLALRNEVLNLTNTVTQ